jgi:hypothetical protein
LRSATSAKYRGSRLKRSSTTNAASSSKYALLLLWLCSKERGRVDASNVLLLVNLSQHVLNLFTGVLQGSTFGSVIVRQHLAFLLKGIDLSC